MSYFLTFIAGCVVGGIFGIFATCAMVVAGQADDRADVLLTKQEGREK